MIWSSISAHHPTIGSLKSDALNFFGYMESSRDFSIVLFRRINIKSLFFKYFQSVKHFRSSNVVHDIRKIVANEEIH